MRRREFLGAGAAFVATFPFRRLLADTGKTPEPGWRNFEVTTRTEVLKPEGASRVWLPLPLPADTDYQRASGNTWTGNAKKMEGVKVGRFGVPMLYAEW